MSHNARVLVVDDDPVVLETVRDCLSDEGYCVETAPSVDEALLRLGEGHFSLVLTDALVRLRDDRPDYWGAIEQIRAAAGMCPVAIFSAHEAKRFAGLEARGFAALIAKPFEVDEFCDTVRQLVDRAHATA